MAHTGAQAQEFFEDLQAKDTAIFRARERELCKHGQATWLRRIEPWDVAYVAEKQRLALYDFDEEELRPYFELERVVAGMFDIFSRVLGIEVIEEPGVPGGIRRSNIIV